MATFALLNTGYSALNTISRLDVVEAQRDQWQRPTDILQALAITPGDTVAEIGCGSGYFSLKLSAAVGKGGRVYAEDIRRLPLVFLWFRTILKNDPNIRVVHGQEGDPRLGAQAVNEALIANTYHELTDPQAILAYVRRALISGGRLVVVDRAPNSAQRDDDPLAEHEISAERWRANFARRNSRSLLVKTISSERMPITRVGGSSSRGNHNCRRSPGK